ISNRSKVSTPKTLKDILPAVYKKLELQSSPDFNPIKTGYTDIDKLMYLDPGTYIVLAARPSMGKTSLATSMMTFIAESNPEKYCLFFSIEMRSENIVSKILSQHSKVDLRNVRTGELRADDWDKLAFSTDRMSAMSNLIIIDNPAITVHNMQTIAMNYATKKGISAIFVDFMQIIQPPTHTLKHGRVEEMTAISSGLKQMSRVLDVPLIALSQLSREVEKRGNKKPVNSDLRDSGSIEQDADVICFIYRDEVYYDDSPHKGIAELLFRKNREGPTGKVRLCYTGKYTKFTNINEPVYGV
ncbi:replicative DNA helicase, partial [Candidatus Pacearchaeota archaeon]|nr:replicative DNA helicase [Candidatus Pacearchaeota archaeon]